MTTRKQRHLEGIKAWGEAAVIDGQPCIVVAPQTCGFELCDGNADDPDYFYCGHPFGHAGEHGEWQS